MSRLSEGDFGARSSFWCQVSTSHARIGSLADPPHDELLRGACFNWGQMQFTEPSPEPCANA